MSIEPEGLSLIQGANQTSRDLVIGSHVRRFADRSFLLHDQGDPKAVYAILEGEVRVERRGVLIARRGPGELVGEQAFIDLTRHSADLIADGDVRALEIGAATMERLLTDPVAARTLLSIVSHKLREATGDRYNRYAEKQKLFAAFGLFVDARFRDDLLEKGDAFGTPHFACGVIVLFTDVRGSTAAAAGMDPMLLGEQLGNYVGRVGDILRSHGAFVDKFIGDGVMAFWGYPGMPEPDASVAIAAAKQIVAESTQMRLGAQPMRTGVGINVGDVFMGNVGSDERRQFTIMGDAVNLAARFEGLTKELGADIVCARRLYDLLPAKDRDGFVYRSAVPVKGAVPQDVFIHSLEERVK